MKNKKGDGLTLNTIVIAVIVLIVLFVMIFLVYKYIVKGTNEGLDPITASTKIKTCCANLCIGAPAAPDCNVDIAKDCNNCQLTSPGTTSTQTATS